MVNVRFMDGSSMENGDHHPPWLVRFRGNSQGAGKKHGLCLVGKLIRETHGGIMGK